jgi:hypothetical protein
MSFGSFTKDVGHGFTGTISKVVSAPFNLAGKAISGATGAVVGIANAGAKATGSIFSGVLQAPGKVIGGVMGGLGISGTTTLVLIGGGILALVVIPRLIPKAK